MKERTFIRLSSRDDREQWLKDRSSMLTASRMADALAREGTARRYQLVMELAGLEKAKDVCSIPAVQAGIYLEDGILRWWLDTRKKEYRGRRADHLLAYRKNPFLGATPDAYIYNKKHGLGVLEIKNVSRKSYMDFPKRNHLLQLETQMLVVGCSYGMIVACVEGQRLEERFIPTDHTRRSSILSGVSELQKDVEIAKKGFAL